MPKPVILLSIPALREKDVAVMREAAEPHGRRRNRRADAQFSLRDLPRADEHDHGPRPGGAWRGGQRVLLAREASGGDVDGAERLRREAADLGPALASRPGADVGRVVSHAQQRLRGRFRLHARPHPQPRRLGIALVLHPAGGAIRHAPRSVGPLSADALLGTDGQRRGDRMDCPVGGDCRAAMAARLLLHLPAGARLRRTTDRPGERRRRYGRGRTGRR